MSETTHTPGEFYVYDQADDDGFGYPCCIGSSDPTADWVAGGIHNRADADRIVLCCNAHDRLESAVIASASWSEQTLTVAFHSGAVWAYDAVPIEVALMLIADKSPGGFLTKWIKPKYHGRKLMEVKG